MNKTLAFDESKCAAFVESKTLARNKSGLPPDLTPYVISSVVRAHFNCWGFLPLVAPSNIWLPVDKYLQRVTRETWMIGGEYKETVETQDRVIVSNVTSETVYSPSPEAYFAASTTINPEDLTSNELTATHTEQIYGGSGTPYPQYYKFEQTLSAINTFESCWETCSALLDIPNIDGDIIGTDIQVRYLGNDGDDVPIEGFVFGDVYVTKSIPSYDPDLPLSFYDQVAAIPGRFDYTIGDPESVVMWRSKVQITGPTCRTYKRFVNPIETPSDGTVVKCVPFDVAVSPLQTIYLNPPCRRGFDFWLDDLWQERTPFAPTECSLPGESGDDPDCSLS